MGNSRQSEARTSVRFVCHRERKKRDISRREDARKKKTLFMANIIHSFSLFLCRTFYLGSLDPISSQRIIHEFESYLVRAERLSKVTKICPLDLLRHVPGVPTLGQLKESSF